MSRQSQVTVVLRLTFWIWKVGGLEIKGVILGAPPAYFPSNNSIKMMQPETFLTGTLLLDLGMLSIWISHSSGRLSNA